MELDETKNKVEVEEAEEAQEAENDINLFWALESIVLDREKSEVDKAFLEFQKKQKYENDKRIVLEAIEKSEIFPCLEECWRGDKDVALAAMIKDGSALEFASARLQDDREVVMAAVKKYGIALKFASARLQSDREVVEAAVKKDGSAIKFACEKLRDDKELALMAVKNWGFAIYHISERLKRDRDIVKVAVSDSFFHDILEFDFLKEFKNDKEVVMIAVKDSAKALKFASKELQQDPDVLALLETEQE